MRDLSVLIPRVEALLRAGQGKAAREILTALARSRRSPPREYAAELASLAWRADLAELGARFLVRIVRPPRATAAPATADEIAEYAQCLVKLGALDEAGLLLDGIREVTPNALLYRAAAKMSAWSYAEAYPLLARYLRLPGIAPYRKLVARVNLAACLVAMGEYTRAKMHLAALLHDLAARKLGLLYGTALNLAAQNFALRGKLGEVDRCLDAADRTLSGMETVDQLFLRKWRAIARVMSTKADRASLRALGRVRDEAERRGHWETVRHCDECETLATRAPGLIARVYFGTPFSAFRDRFERDLGSPVPGERYVWQLGRAVRAPTVDLLDPARGLKEGTLLFRLAGTLLSDFYRPLRPAALFVRIFPGEHYNPHSGPHRVHQAIRRLRGWLDARGIPLRIVGDESGYRLQGKPSVRLVVPRPGRGLARTDVAVERLRRATQGPFSSKDAERVLGLESRTAVRVLRDAVERGALVREGSGRRTRYRIAS